jgi:hypothetical protein
MSCSKSNSGNNSGSNKDTSSLLQGKWYLKEVIDYDFTGVSIPPDTTFIIHDDYYDFSDGIISVDSWVNAYLTYNTPNNATFYISQDSEYTSATLYSLHGNGIQLSSSGLTDTLLITQINDTGMVLFQDVNPLFPYWNQISIFHR